MFILSECLILFSLKGVGHIVIWQVRLHSELGVCGGTWQSSLCQWCRGWREWGQTCSGSLATLWRQTGPITDEATFTWTQVLTKIVLAHWEVGKLLTVWSCGMFFFFYENLCCRFAAIWQLSQWNPILVLLSNCSVRAKGKLLSLGLSCVPLWS